MQYSGLGPATIEYVNEYWSNRLVPYGDIYRHVTTTTVAIRGDGSRAVAIKEQLFHHYLIESLTASYWMLFDASAQRFIRSAVLQVPRFDESHGREASCLTHPRVQTEARDCPPPGDHIAKFEHEFRHRRRLPDRTHLGFRVTVWRDDSGTEEWLAPRFHCASMKTERTGERRWLVPSEYSRQELAAIRYGEPDPRLFDPHRP